MYLLPERGGIYFGSCYRKTRVKGDSKILDQENGRIKFVFTEMGKVYEGEMKSFVLQFEEPMKYPKER